ncbi:MAG: hypothetical protein RLN88_01045 [Ekhidna sp.]|uniref:hypothetical protein n=1 Tax=Ekhidna sp. TaxID=2608089 RepID=UPI0032EC3F0C
MKRTFGFFVLEFMVIFIGIVSSFIFDEWREQRQLQEKKNEILSTILQEIEDEKNFLHNNLGKFNQEDIHITDSLFGKVLPKPSTLLRYLKKNFFIVDVEEEGEYLPNWHTFISNNDAEMSRIRNTVENQRIIRFIEYYLLTSKRIETKLYGNDFAISVKDLLDDDILADLDHSWSESLKLYKAGNIHADLNVGDIALKGDYGKLMNDREFKRAIRIHRTTIKDAMLYIERQKKRLDALEKDIVNELITSTPE